MKIKGLIKRLRTMLKKDLRWVFFWRKLLYAVYMFFFVCYIMVGLWDYFRHMLYNSYGQKEYQAIFVQVAIVESFFHKLEQLIIDYRVDLFLTQISATFITISVLSIFSDKPKKIYWENEVDESLKKPILLNYKGLTVIAFVFMILNLLLLGASGRLWIAFGIIFFLNVVDLAVLTIKMVNIYFKEDKRAKKLEKKFVKLDPDSSVFKRYIYELRINTKEAFETANLEEFSRNISFYFKYYWKIDVEELEIVKHYLNEDRKLAYIFHGNAKNVMYPLLLNDSFFSRFKFYHLNQQQYAGIIKYYMCEYGKSDENKIIERFNKMKEILSEIGEMEDQNDHSHTVSQVVESFTHYKDYLFSEFDDEKKISIMEDQELYFDNDVIKKYKRRLNSWFRKLSTDEKKSTKSKKPSNNEQKKKINNSGSGKSCFTNPLTKKDIDAIQAETYLGRKPLFVLVAILIVGGLYEFMTAPYHYGNKPGFCSKEVRQLSKMEVIHAGDTIPEGKFQADCLIGSFSKAKGGDFYYVDALIDGKQVVYLRSDEDLTLTSGSKVRLIGELDEDWISHYSLNMDINYGPKIYVYEPYELPYQYTFKP